MSDDRRSCPVAARFSAAANSYDESYVQRTVAQRLMQMVGDRESPSAILEVGCGTGIMTRLLCERFPNAEIQAIDVAEAMVARAQQQLADNPRATCSVADIRALAIDRAFPLIVSSSALHWAVPLSGTMCKLASLLDVNGCLVAALMVYGTLDELRSARVRVAPDKHLHLELPRADDVLAAARAAGLDILDERVDNLRTEYDSADAFLRKLHAQGVTGRMAASAPLLNRTELRRLVDDYARTYAAADGGVFATYCVLYLVAVSEACS